MNKYKTLTEESLNILEVNSEEDSALDLIKTDVIGFCGCGTYEVCYLIRDILKEMKEFRELRKKHNELNLNTDNIYEEHDKKMLDLVGGKQIILDFIYYWLNDKDFSEHGTIIPGWLTKRGYDLLHDLELAIKEEENHE